MTSWLIALRINKNDWPFSILYLGIIGSFPFGNSSMMTPWVFTQLVEMYLRSCLLDDGTCHGSERPGLILIFWTRDDVLGAMIHSEQLLAAALSAVLIGLSSFSELTVKWIWINIDFELADFHVPLKLSPKSFLTFIKTVDSQIKKSWFGFEQGQCFPNILFLGDTHCCVYLAKFFQSLLHYQPVLWENPKKDCLVNAKSKDSGIRNSSGWTLALWLTINNSGIHGQATYLWAQLLHMKE